MKKIFIFLLLIAVAGSLSADNHSLSQDWYNLTAEEKSMFVLGVFAGGFASVRFVELISDHPNLAQHKIVLYAMNREIERLFSNITISDEENYSFIYHIDNFYEEDVNEDVDLFSAVMIILRDLSKDS